jgi:hypothetical protein
MRHGGLFVFALKGTTAAFVLAMSSIACGAESLIELTPAEKTYIEQASTLTSSPTLAEGHRF